MAETFKSLSTCDYSYNHPVFLAIAEQLPQGLRERLSVEITMDSYYLGCVATFTTGSGDRFTTKLQSMELPNGKYACARIPEAFVAHLCLVVR